MPAVLVHGVPDTHRLWGKLLSRLSRRDIVTPSLPGFGVPIPPGFEPTKESYVTWLIGEVERLGEPVDLVGHDWRCLLVHFLDGCGHWWPLEKPAEAAVALERFWRAH